MKLHNKNADPRPQVPIRMPWEDGRAVPSQQLPANSYYILHLKVWIWMHAPRQLKGPSKRLSGRQGVRRLCHADESVKKTEPIEPNEQWTMKRHLSKRYF